MRLLLVTIAFLSGTAFADEPPMFAEQPGTRGILYVVHGKSGPALYLFGTIHVGTSTQTPFSHAVKAALEHSRRLALEADPNNLMSAMSGMIAMGRYPAGDSLDKHLPPKVLTDLRATLAREHIPADQIMGLKLWALPEVLTMAPTQRAGLDAQFGADMFLAAWAKQHAIPIVELEGFPFQLHLLADGTEKEQLALLVDELDEMKKKDVATELKKLVALWLAGDEKGMETQLLDDSDKSEAGRHFEEKLLDKRNVSMTDKAEGLLKEPGDTFFAVGSAHLLGPKGIVALLRKRGYDVKPLR